MLPAEGGTAGDGAGGRPAEDLLEVAGVEPEAWADAPDVGLGEQLAGGYIGHHIEGAAVGAAGGLLGVTA